MMSGAYISAIAALAGSAVGGLTSLTSAWMTQHRQDRAARLAQDRAKRREVYALFIEEASKIYADALVHDKTEIASLVGVYSLINQMRILSSPAVIENAEEVVRVIVSTYSTPNMTLPELRDLLNNNKLDLLRAFSAQCRIELNSV